MALKYTFWSHSHSSCNLLRISNFDCICYCAANLMPWNIGICVKKDKGKDAPLYRHWGCVQAVRPRRGSGGIAVLFLEQGTRMGWGVSVTPRPLFTAGKEPVPVVQGAGWAPGPVWTGAENLTPTEIRSPARPSRSQSLYRLRCPGPQDLCSSSEIICNK
jgi:hypothetical protein